MPGNAELMSRNELDCSLVHNQSKKAVRFDMLRLARIRRAIQASVCSAILENIDMCMLFFCHCLYRTGDVPMDMLKLAGRRPAINKHTLELC